MGIMTDQQLNDVISRLASDLVAKLKSDCLGMEQKRFTMAALWGLYYEGRSHERRLYLDDRPEVDRFNDIEVRNRQ